MENSSKLQDAPIRFLIAAGLTFFSAWRLLPLADEIGLLKGTVGGPFHAIVEYAVWQIVFTLALVIPALWLTDRLLKSRTLKIFLSLAALIAVHWLTASDW